jgi:hypothetical protein
MRTNREEQFCSSLRLAAQGVGDPLQASGMGMALTDFRAMKNYLAVTVVVFGIVVPARWWMSPARPP